MNKEERQSVCPKIEGTLEFKGGLVNLVLPRILEFYNQTPDEAIRRVFGCIGLSEYERRQISKAIYYFSNPKKEEFF